MESARAILKKIRHLELKTRGMVEAAFAGQYRSVFKGRGMNFEEVREYQPGDEVRTIDWNVTARYGEAVREEVHGGTGTDGDAAWSMSAPRGISGACS